MSLKPAQALAGTDPRSDTLPAARPADHVVAATQADRTILLDMNRGRYYALNEQGGIIWEMLRANASRAEIEDRLEALYDAPRDRIVADLAALLAQLRGKGLVS